jgi:hypothetical protein
MKSRQVKHDGGEGKKKGEREIWGQRESNMAAGENGVG